VAKKGVGKDRQDILVVPGSYVPTSASDNDQADDQGPPFSPMHRNIDAAFPLDPWIPTSRYPGGDGRPCSSAP
jgi:hypothetical protein